MTFGQAVKMLGFGAKVSREGWNGKGMWLVLIPGGTTHLPSGERFPADPFIAMKTVQGMIVPWVASQTDMLAGDWGSV